MPRRILLVSTDLIAAARLAHAARGLGDLLEVESPTTPAATVDGGYDVVLVDLQSCPDAALAIGRARGLAPAGRIVAFGPHVWRERLEAAVAAGADEAASRGEVLGSLPALLERLSRGSGGPPENRGDA